MLNCVIIDDEQPARATITRFLTKQFEDISIAGEADSVSSGIELLKTISPDFIFLDVDLGDGNGFELLDKIGTIDFELIFVTAYDEYAIQAIKYSASDYLLKPVHPEEMKTAIEKVRQNIQKRKQLNSLQPMIARLINNGTRLCVPDLKGISFIPMQHIVWLQTAGRYTTIKEKEGAEHISVRTLKEFEDLLPPSVFFRIHNSSIINLGQVARYIKGEGGQVVMSNQDELEVSRRKKNELIDRLSQINLA
jgi:two-component system LytT family response regulator